jgi:hypothetical protein
VRAGVRFALRAHICRLVPSGFPGRSSERAGPGSRPWSSAADGAASLRDRPAGRGGIWMACRPTSAGCPFTACSLVIEVIPEPGRIARPAFPQSIFLYSYFVATTERFYAEGPTEDPRGNPSYGSLSLVPERCHDALSRCGRSRPPSGTGVAGRRPGPGRRPPSDRPRGAPAAAAAVPQPPTSRSRTLRAAGRSYMPIRGRGLGRRPPMMLRRCLTARRVGVGLPGLVTSASQSRWLPPGSAPHPTASSSK